jgi:tetratricopeptide (TPR) repeat protein
VALVAAGLTTLVRPAFSTTSEKKIPVAVVFNMTFKGDKVLQCNPEVAAEIMGELAVSGVLKPMTYSSQMPAVKRAILTNQILQTDADKPSNLHTVLLLGQILGADYVLQMSGTADVKNVTVDLEMSKPGGNEHWVSSTKGVIQDSGIYTAENRKNTILATVSSTISKLLIPAFGATAARQAADSTAKVCEQGPSQNQPPTPRNISAEFENVMGESDRYRAAHNTSAAISALKRAINLDPRNSAPRVKLAGIYSELGLAAQAIDECNRALLFDPGNAEILRMLGKLYVEGGSVDDASRNISELVKRQPGNADIRILLGDLLWNQAKIDDAAASYEEAAKLAPSSSVPHDKLYKLNMARRRYAPALEQLMQARMLGGAPINDSARYGIIAQIVQDEFNAVLGNIKAGQEELDSKRIAREDYYQECKESTARVEALSDFIAAQSPSAGYSAAHPHGVLAVSLLCQATAGLVSFFETEKEYYFEQSGLFRKEAQTEMDLFAKALPQKT